MKKEERRKKKKKRRIEGQRNTKEVFCVCVCVCLKTTTLLSSGRRITGIVLFLLDLDVIIDLLGKSLTLGESKGFTLEELGVRVETHQQKDGDLDLVEHVQGGVVHVLFESDLLMMVSVDLVFAST